jgi:hypothetical protein
MHVEKEISAIKLTYSQGGVQVDLLDRWIDLSDMARAIQR